MTIHVFYLHKFSFSSIGGPTLRIWLAFSWTSFVRTSGLNSIKRSAALGKLQNFQPNLKKFLNFLKLSTVCIAIVSWNKPLLIIVFSIETFFVVWMIFYASSWNVYIYLSGFTTIHYTEIVRKINLDKSPKKLIISITTEMPIVSLTSKIAPLNKAGFCPL